jgi:hypothetical protein
MAEPEAVDSDEYGKPRYIGEMLMRADYDSEADALDIELVPFKYFERQEQVHDSFCTVGFSDGRLVDVELLTPGEHLDLLDVVADRYDLDGAALTAAAQAALAAPDRIVQLDVSAQIAA